MNGSCLIEVALRRAHVVCPEPCIVCRREAAVELAVPAGLLQAEHLSTTPSTSSTSTLYARRLKSCSTPGMEVWWLCTKHAASPILFR